MHRSLLAAMLSLSVLLCTLAAAQDASYNFTIFDVPGSTNQDTNGINKTDQIVGVFSDSTGHDHGFLKDGTTFTSIDVPSSIRTAASGINNTGQIVGTFHDGTRSRGFLKDGTTFTSIDVPGARLTEALGINTVGQIVGTFHDGTRLRGFLKDGDNFTTFDVPGATLTAAIGINESGQIVGYFLDATSGRHGFLKDGDTFTPIDVPGARFTEAFGINESGQIVGWFSPPTGPESGFLKDGDTFTPIDVPGATLTAAKGINESGQIVGTFRDATGNHGFLAIPLSVPVIVEIDIKPGGDDNCININGNGVIVVAILGNEDFDVTQIDVDSLLFAGLEVRVKGNDARQCSVEDVSGDFTSPEGAPDGFDDLVCQFVDDPMSWNPGDATATLTGELLDGTPFEGSDSICIVP